MKNKMVDISQYDAVLIHANLTNGYRKLKKDYELLKISKNRDLTDEEREQLPTSLMGATRNELKEQIDGYYSGVLQYESLLEEFDPNLF